MLDTRSRFRPVGTYRQIGLMGVVALVALRVIIGWHFYMEGATKVREGGFSSVGFLTGAKGPLASKFQALVPDHDGKTRLDAELMKSEWKSYVEKVSTRYQFNDDQKKSADLALKESVDRLDEIYAQWSPQISEYKNGFDRIDYMSHDPKRNGVESLRKQKDEIETKWKGLVKPVLSDIDKVSRLLESRLAGIGDANVVASVGAIPYELPGQGLLSVRLVDKIIPIFDMSVGILLILGLLTPVAALAAGLFLASIVLTQFPGYPGTQPTYYQAIEMVACFCLAFSDAGRYAGLDFIPWSFWNRRSATA